MMDNNQKPKQGESQKGDGRSSLGNFDRCSNYEQAFIEAHNIGGPGQTFTYQDKVYSTDRTDGKDMRKECDKKCSNEQFNQEKDKEWNVQKEREQEKFPVVEGQTQQEREKLMQKDKGLGGKETEKERLKQLEKEKEKGTS